MMTIDRLKELLAAAEGCVCRDPLTCGHREARLRRMYLAEAFAEELVKSQEHINLHDMDCCNQVAQLSGLAKAMDVVE